jgi:hypothetical protein
MPEFFLKKQSVKNRSIGPKQEVTRDLKNIAYQGDS